MNSEHNLDARAFQEWQAESLADIAESHSHIYRECARQLIPVLHRAMDWCSASRERMWACMFALSHPDCMGRSMSDVATQIKVSRATISELSTRFCEENKIPPSHYMKTEQDQQQSRLLRIKAHEKKKQKSIKQ